MKNAVEALSHLPHPYTSLDRILERVLDFFDEFEGLGLNARPEDVDRRFANLAVLQRRIAAALWLFGDTRRAFLLGFPESPEAQQATLNQCAGDRAGRFVGVYTVDGETHEEERMALCLFQAEVEFRYHLLTLGRRVTFLSVRPAEVRSDE